MSGLEQQFTLSKRMYEEIAQVSDALDQVRSVRAQIENIKKGSGQQPAAQVLASLDATLKQLEGQETRRRTATGPAPDTLVSIQSALQTLFGALQSADVVPTSQTVEAVSQNGQKVAPLLARWSEIKNQELRNANAQLRAANLPELKPELPGPKPEGPGED